MTEPYTVIQEPPEEEEEAVPAAAACGIGTSDLTCVPSELLTAEDFPWSSPGGITVAANTRKAGIEYAKQNNLQALKILLVRRKPKPVGNFDFYVCCCCLIIS